MTDEQSQFFAKRTHRNFLMSMSVPATSRVVIKGFEKATACDLVVLACAIERYQIDKGAYPDSLEKLIPGYLHSLPLDRFSRDEKPLQYRLDGDRYLLYSVGENGIDENGQGKGGEKNVKTPEDDISWGYADFE